MYKLTVVAGSNRGTDFKLDQGIFSIGRHSTNDIVLPSSKISKHHCKIIVDAHGIKIEDQASSNGTFVNGKLARSKKIQPGDRISIGSFVLELTRPRTRSKAPVILDLSKVIQFPTSGVQERQKRDEVAINTKPSDPKERVAWYFENYVMPLFYGLNLKHEWKWISFCIFMGFVVINLLISMQPLLIENKRSVTEEAMRRAQFMAEKIAEDNVTFLAEKREVKTSTGNVGNAEGVREALLVDLDSRILAPSDRFGQYLANGLEAVLVRKAVPNFRKGRQSGMRYSNDQNTVVWIEPVKLFDQTLGQNVPVALAIVSLDTSLSLPGMSTILVRYFETFVISFLIGSFMLFILYRLTLKRYEFLASDIDKVLSGDLDQVTNEFQCPETNKLWDLVNSTLQRIPKGPEKMGGGDSVDVLSDHTEDVVSMIDSIRLMAENAEFGVVLFDENRKIIFMNTSFEDLTGIRGEEAIGQNIGSVASDQSFGAFAEDLFDRLSSVQSLSDTYEFSGVEHKMHGSSLGANGGKGFLIFATKVEAA